MNTKTKAQAQVSTSTLNSDLDKFVKTNEQRLGNLYGRWQDEREYEDFADYIDEMKKLVYEPFTFVSATQRPFSMLLDYAGLKTLGVRVTVTSTAIKATTFQRLKATGPAKTGKKPVEQSKAALPAKSSSAAAPIAPALADKIATTARPEDEELLPSFCRVENRKPLTDEQKARLAKVQAAARVTEPSKEDLRLPKSIDDAGRELLAEMEEQKRKKTAERIAALRQSKGLPPVTGGATSPASKKTDPQTRALIDAALAKKSTTAATATQPGNTPTTQGDDTMSKTTSKKTAPAARSTKTSSAAKKPGAAKPATSKPVKAAKKAGDEGRAKNDWGAWAEKAAKGVVPPAPDFSANTHRSYRPLLAEVVKLANARDLKGLEAYKIKGTSTSPNAVKKYRALVIQALKVKKSA